MAYLINETVNVAPGLETEILLQILSEMRCMRIAMTFLACEGGQASPRDFDPQTVQTDAEIADSQQI